MPVTSRDPREPDVRRVFPNSQVGSVNEFLQLLTTTRVSLTPASGVLGFFGGVGKKARNAFEPIKKAFSLVLRNASKPLDSLMKPFPGRNVNNF